MTTADRTPHPWVRNSASTPTSPNPPLPRRSASSQGERTAATSARMLLDEHRSQNGLCVRCGSPWPCDVTRSVRIEGMA